MFRSSAFDKILDDVTNNYQLDINWDSVLKICDIIRQGDINPKDALKKITKKVSSSNQHTAMYGLQVLESCVKNCGPLIQTEISSKEYMEQYKDIIEKCTHENVKTKALDLLQSWAHAFRQIVKYRPVIDTMNLMKHEGYKFPVFRESRAMFLAEVAPPWKDSARCHRCKVEFNFKLRKHHCRACGEVFCYQCSSQTLCLPKLGIEKEVRVCISCYDKHKPGINSKGEELPSEYVTSSLAQQNQNPPPKKTEEELKEEEEIQLALALSESELESKRSVYRPVTRAKSFSPPIPQVSAQRGNEYENEDLDLARYLNRKYWNSRASSSDQSDERETQPSNHGPGKDKTTEQNGFQSESEVDKFVNTLRDHVEIFVNRMKSNSSRGRSISNDSSVQSLFMNITAMHCKLLRYIRQQDDARLYFEGLQDKLTQVKDARAALDALREEHRDRQRREAELAERLRQIQMAQKLEMMRVKKHEYLQYQRQLALQRIRDQEREMHLRQELQKQQYRLASGLYGSKSYMGPPQGVASVFEPVTSMGVPVNNLPLGSVTVTSYNQPPFPPQYTHGQAVNTVGPPPQPQMVASQQGPMMMGQGQFPTDSFVPGNHPNPLSNQPLAVAGQQPPSQYPVNRSPNLDEVMNVQVQPVHANLQNPHGTHSIISQAGGLVHLDSGIYSIAPSQRARIEPNRHLMGPMSGPPQPGSVLHHPNVVRPMMPPSSPPLSSPSSSSEHSIVHHGPQPMPSAPSATTTPQPEEKEEVAELISFD